MTQMKLHKVKLVSKSLLADRILTSVAIKKIQFNKQHRNQITRRKQNCQKKKKLVLFSSPRKPHIHSVSRPCISGLGPFPPAMLD